VPTPTEIEVFANTGANGSVILSFTRTDIPYTQVARTKSVDELIESVEHYFLWVEQRYPVHCFYDRTKLRRVWQTTQPPKVVPTITYEQVDMWKNVGVDLTEALIGWKCWNMSDDNKLQTQGETVWTPDEPLESRCTVAHFSPRHSAPHPGCNCGVHGATERSTAEGYGKVLGEVYGWGRYCRHEAGWRAQFAYPKSFLLGSEQVELIEHLRAYHVPIFIMQPTLIYNPEEDGYEYGNTETYWSSGTGKDTDAGQEGGTSEEGDYEG
jgi:hypothetical protein